VEEERERATDLAEPLDDDPTARHRDAELDEGGPRAHDAAGGRGALMGTGATDGQRLAGDGPGHVVALRHRQGVHQPRHHAAVGVHVGRGDVAVRAEERADLVGVATGEALELVEGQQRRVAAHPALGAAEGQIEDGRLERHRGGQRLHLVGIDVGVEADAALAGAAGGVVVDPPPGEHLDGAVVHADRHRHLEHALGGAEDAVDVGIQIGELGGVVESIEHGLPGVGGHVGCWPLPRAVVSARPDRSTRPALPESGYPARRALVTAGL
jgi:hypothetical protein